MDRDDVWAVAQTPEGWLRLTPRYEPYQGPRPALPRLAQAAVRSPNIGPPEPLYSVSMPVN